jgi:hypothetical protein
LGPKLTATRAELAIAGIEERPEVLRADAGHWHDEQMEKVTASGVRLLCPPEAATRHGTRPGLERRSL